MNWQEGLKHAFEITPEMREELNRLGKEAMMSPDKVVATVEIQKQQTIGTPCAIMVDLRDVLSVIDDGLARGESLYKAGNLYGIHVRDTLVRAKKGIKEIKPMDLLPIEIRKQPDVNQCIEIRNVGQHTLTVQRPDGTELEIMAPRSEGDHRARKVVPDGSVLVRMKRA